MHPLHVIVATITDLKEIIVKNWLNASSVFTKSKLKGKQEAVDRLEETEKADKYRKDDHETENIESKKVQKTIVEKAVKKVKGENIFKKEDKAKEKNNNKEDQNQPSLFYYEKT